MTNGLPANITTELPTLDRLGVTLADDIDARAIASNWFSTFDEHVQSNNIDGIINLFVTDCWWRDLLALTWDFRTFKGPSAIKAFLSDRLALSKLSGFKLRSTSLERPFPDIAWIQTLFDFETDVGIGFGIVRLIPNPNGEWKAHVLFTNLEALKDFPEKIGRFRSYESNHGEWEEGRKREAEFRDGDPSVLIIGGGHNGLDLAARLKALGVSTLIVEKNEKIGDNWAKRYKALCLHDPVWYDHMPYLPFPPTWPVYTPALKLANWFQYYADALELNVWTSTTVLKASQDSSTKKWHVTVQRADGTERIFVVTHLVFATGYASNVPYYPKVDGMDKFKGQILHSSQHKKATDHAGKKVVVIGSCTSAHDICSDYYKHGVDVTMFQRSSTYVVSTAGSRLLLSSYSENGPPTDMADRLVHSFPLCMNVGIVQRTAAQVAEFDKKLLASLKERGFRTNMGILETSIWLLVFIRLGGYYLDVGASKLIAEGKIKLKNDSQIASFTETGLKFENGSELAADVVLFATGLGDPGDIIQSICGSEVADRFGKVWGLNDEGEVNGCWRDLKVEGLWYMLGNLAMSRFHSKHVALQIKAREEGLYNGRYSLNA
ncbi:hypothetical protein AX16_002518 [Volvariella volvacea WC 439]|nr:hypothetical protein AX16_002518 [Volvariella volvacea WC 439]